MIKTNFYKGIILGILLLLITNPVLAKENSFSAGIIGGWQSSLYRDYDSDSERFVSPIFQLKYGIISINGTELKLRIASAEKRAVYMVGNYRLQGYDADDSDYLEGMDDRDAAFEIGLASLFYTKYGEVELKVFRDVSSAYEGYLSSLTWSAGYEWRKLKINTKIGGEWLSDDFTNYYFGVNQDEVRVNRPRYNPDSAFRYSLGLDLVYPITQKAMLIGSVGTTFYSDEVKDSPIVSDDRSNWVMLGVGYMF